MDCSETDVTLTSRSSGLDKTEDKKAPPHNIDPNTKSWSAIIGEIFDLYPKQTKPRPHQEPEIYLHLSQPFKIPPPSPQRVDPVALETDIACTSKSDKTIVRKTDTTFVHNNVAPRGKGTNSPYQSRKFINPSHKRMILITRADPIDKDAIEICPRTPMEMTDTDAEVEPVTGSFRTLIFGQSIKNMLPGRDASQDVLPTETLDEPSLVGKSVTGSGDLGGNQVKSLAFILTKMNKIDVEVRRKGRGLKKFVARLFRRRKVPYSFVFVDLK